MGTAMERGQAPLCLAALAVGAGIGIVAPTAAPALGTLVTPSLALLLFATFLSVPFGRIAAGLRDVRFLLTVTAVNVIAAPVVAIALSRLVPVEDGLRIGVLLVLLAPCVDYVVAFTGLAQGAKDRLLAATPLLLLGQALLLPVVLPLVAGGDVPLSPGPFVEAALLLLALPCAAALVVQLAARRRPVARRVRRATDAAMVPLTMLTLALVAGSQAPRVAASLGSVAALVPLYAAFAVALLVLGVLAGRIARTDLPGQRAVALSGMTRNSLVVLPFALALPESAALAPAAVVTQTLVELVALASAVPLLRRLGRPPRISPSR